MVHGGTLVVHGTGRAVVVATGAAPSSVGSPPCCASTRAPATPLQRRLAALGRRLSLVAVLGCALVVVLGLLRGESWELMVVAGISLAVAAIPESLPAVVALALAAATRRMAAQGRHRPIAARGRGAGLGDRARHRQDRHPHHGQHGLRRAVDAGRWRAPTGTPTPAILRRARRAGRDRPTGPARGGRAVQRRAAGAQPGTEGALAGAAAAAGIDVDGLRRRSGPRTTWCPSTPSAAA